MLFVVDLSESKCGGIMLCPGHCYRDEGSLLCISD